MLTRLLKIDILLVHSRKANVKKITKINKFEKSLKKLKKHLTNLKRFVIMMKYFEKEALNDL